MDKYSYGKKEISIFKSKQFGEVRAIINDDGTISINIEDVARGLGWYQIKNNKVYIKWERVNGYAEELGFSPILEKDDYIPESLYYLLCMKANNKMAQEFQRWIAVEILPQIRKNGIYHTGDNYHICENEHCLSPEIRAIFCMDKRTVKMGDRLNKLENNMTIDYMQQEELRSLAVKKVISILGGKNSAAYRELNKKAFRSMWNYYKRIIGVNSYKNTPVIKFKYAKNTIMKWKPDRDLELMIIGANSISL